MPPYYSSSRLQYYQIIQKSTFCHLVGIFLNHLIIPQRHLVFQNLIYSLVKFEALLYVGHKDYLKRLQYLGLSPTAEAEAMGGDSFDRISLGMVGDYWQWFCLLSDGRASISWSFPVVPRWLPQLLPIQHAFEAGRKGKEQLVSAMSAFFYCKSKEALRILSNKLLISYWSELCSVATSGRAGKGRRIGNVFVG